jgi:hypothetical protein
VIGLRKIKKLRLLVNYPNFEKEVLLNKNENYGFLKETKRC